MSELRRVAIAAIGCAVVAAGAVGGACSNAGAGRLLTVDATGTVGGLVYFDQNGTRVFDENVDRRLPGVDVLLALATTGTVVAQATSDNEGAFRIAGVPVGNYTIVVDDGTIGDSVQVVRVDTSAVRVGPDDSVGVTVTVSFPILTIAEARARAVGDKIFVTGVALSPVTAFADSTVHLRDVTGSLRATRVAGSTVQQGDSGRFLGRRSATIGQPTLDGVRFFSLGSAGLPQPETVSAAEAAGADGGRLDAALVQVFSATIVDTTRNQAGDYVMQVDDGSGVAEVIVDVDLGVALTQFIPGATVAVTGVLVPTSELLQRWAIKPRSGADLRRL